MNLRCMSPSSFMLVRVQIMQAFSDVLAPADASSNYSPGVERKKNFQENILCNSFFKDN